ncbi:MAG: flagellar basal-body rod protein FlgG [Bacillota bacterium]|jgi:flagellar basal-body rod protein FlgG|nr:flagellar basal-body rod protein FlgG [Candidatus Fermentithermobacillaceae bacterium]HAF66845.1 flagellar basal-body rod protein FlgG [Clostridiales bacterium UBA9857]HOA70266.1 flagellar basal-body rod protein FlgG [Bacillota bacterium]HOP70214.1 flagellar basal-body rod protein FlgG [Bacillota bacterium]HPT35338.1 flagellar basal-body rod protein FlgG [Bacillota bacterium]
MIRALWSGATGMTAQQFNIDNIANNLANVNTTGFKRQRVDFQDLYYQNILVGRNTTASVGSGVRAAGTYRDFQQGALEKADDPLFMAIQGKGFFTIIGPDGNDYYTRDGSFRLDGQGRLVTATGHFVRLRNARPVPRDAQEISVDENGVIWAKVDGEFQAIGQIVLTVFPNPQGLHAIGSNLYMETPQSGEGDEVLPGQDGAGTVLSGYIEKSNVEIVTEMVNLIVAQRAFELNSKSVETADQMWAIANNIRR